MEVCRHYGGVSTGYRNGGDVNLQEFRRICRTVVLLRQLWPELGWSGRCVGVICQHGAAHVVQWDTRLNPGARWGLRRNRSEVVVKVAALDILSSLTHPLQGDAGILARMLAVEFHPQVLSWCGPHRRRAHRRRRLVLAPG
jgi:hypothetical protein